MSNKQTRWFLVSNCGMNFPLHQTMISLGKEGCDIVLQSRSVDKRHALITFDHYEKRFKVKDLNSINGTCLNEIRIPSQTFIKLEHLDTLRFGFDVTVYQIQQVVETFPVPIIPDYRSCNWKVAPYLRHSMKMADCQGCLQKQAVHHTCGLKGPEWVAANQNPSEVRLQSPECTQPVPNSRNSQLCAQMTTDSCGNFPPRPNSGTQRNNPLLHRPDCCPLQTPVIVQQRHASEDPANENKNSSLVRNSATEGNLTQHPYMLPQCQLHSATSHGCTCMSSPQVSIPSEVSRSSKTLAPSPHAGCSSNTSLQSTFSGDSLDTTLDDNTIQLKGTEKTTPSSTNRFLTITKNVQTMSKNVVEAEKPLDSSLPVTECNSTAATSRPVCTAFTIEFDDDPSAAKKLDIKDSISKFAPPKADCETKTGHRKNVLELFSDENGNCNGKRIDCSIEIPKPGSKDTAEREETTSPTMRIMSAAKDKLTKSGMQRGGYHSEGHASSDQEGIDDLSAKSDPERRKLKSDKAYFEVVGLPVKLAERKADGLLHKPNGTIGYRSLPTSDLRDSAKYLINKMFGEITAPTNSPTEPISPTILSALQVEKGKTQRGGLSSSSPSTPGCLQLTKGDSKGGTNLDSISTYTVRNNAEEEVMNGKSRILRNAIKADQRKTSEKDEQMKEMVFSDEEEYAYDQEDEKEDELLMNETIKQEDNGDNVSEAGTYTIESDQKDASEEKKARKNIDSVFGVNGKCGAFKRPIVAEERGDMGPSSPGQKHLESAPDRRSNNGLKDKETPIWLKEWVAQTALKNNDVHASSTATNISNVNARLQQSVQVLPNNGTNESVTHRQRRRLPIPPVDRVQAALPISSENKPVLTQATSSTVASEKLRASSSSTSPDGRRSDSSMDTETILKETENVVSAMEARMDYKQHRSNSGDCDASSARCEDCKDSGGESDVDTSTASGANDVVSCGTYKKNSRQTAAQLKALENNDYRGDRTYRKNRSARECYQGRSTPTGEFGGNYSEGETASVHSDLSSSSEVSGSSPVSGRKCATDKAPLMRFNRAFSLRRARLDCDSDGMGRHSVVQAKTGATPAVSRPSSASSVGSSKEVPRRGSASNRSDSGGSAASAGTPNASGSTFERSDGGRFSLRLPKSAPNVGRTRLKATANNQSSGTKGKASMGGKSAPTPRSNSTLSSKELEMKNWKRRKEYDPLKAAAEGRKKDSAASKTKGFSATTSTSLSKSETHSPTSVPFTRSVSFHGTDGLSLRRNTFTSEDEIVDSIPQEGMIHQGYPVLPTDAFGPLYDLGLKSRTKKSSEDECTSEATRAYSHMDLTSENALVSSPRGSPLLYQSHRHKSKIDALDNLVISTINQVSSNLRGKAQEILKKLGCVHHQECIQCLGAGGLTDLLEGLANGDSPDLSPQGSSVSRQLSAILKNMKRLEESLQAIHKVLDTSIEMDDRCLSKLNGKLKCRDDAPPSRAALSTSTKKKSNNCHVQATF